MNSKRRRSHSPAEYKEGHDKDYGTSVRKDNLRDLDESSNARVGRGCEFGRHSNRHSYGPSRESKRHDDNRRRHDKHADDYWRSHSRASLSDLESRAGAYHDRSKHDSTPGRSRGDQRDAGSRYGEKSFSREERSKKGDEEFPHDYQRRDNGEYDKYAVARKQDYSGRGYGDARAHVDKRDHYRIVGKNKETIEEDVLNKRNGKETEKEAKVETREKRSLFSSSGPNVDCSGDAKTSSTINEAMDNSAGTLDGVNAAKVAAMKAAELVNRNIAAFGAGTGRLSTDQKKKLLWGNKKSNPPEETSNRWDLNSFSDRERQEKFNKLMSLRMPWWLWPIAGCEEQRPSSGEQVCEQGRRLCRSQETGGARYQPGEALHSRPPQERWPDRWSWSVGYSACKCYRIEEFRSLFCTHFSGLCILARKSSTCRIWAAFNTGLSCYS